MMMMMLEDTSTQETFKPKQIYKLLNKTSKINPD